jgi:hypothetical protein
MCYRILAIAFSTCLIASTTTAATKPTRSECIIGFNLNWSSVKNPDDVRNSMGHWSLEVHKVEPLGAMVFSFDGSRLYFQYQSDCDNKTHMAAAVIAYWHAQGLDLPGFERIADPIQPSPREIDVQGPYWSDAD